MRQPLARWGNSKVGRGGKGQDAASGSHTIKDERSRGGVRIRDEGGMEGVLRKQRKKEPFEGGWVQQCLVFLRAPSAQHRAWHTAGGSLFAE